MRRFLILLCAGALFLAGCSKKSSGPVAPGQLQNPNVSFSIRLESGTQGMIFSAKPSADVRLARVIIALPAQQFADTLTANSPTEVQAKDQWVQLNEYTGVDSGQKWAFSFTGVEAATNRPFVSTASYDVP